MSTTGRMPDVFIIGAQKSGTTSLFDWIAQHPRVFGNPAAKDYPYFCDDEIHKQCTKRFAGFFHKAPGSSVVLGGDANAMYVPEAVGRLYEVIPNARLIAILREPSARCFSSWRHAVEQQMEQRSFESAVRDELNGLPYLNRWEGRKKDYLAHGHYAEQIEHFLALYPEANLKVIMYEDLRIAPSQVMHDVYSFLGVAPNFIPHLEKKNVTRGGARFVWLAKLLHGNRPVDDKLFNVFRRIVPAVFRTATRELLVHFNRVPSEVPILSEEMKMMLRDYYAKHVTSLERLLGRCFDDWHS